MHGVHIETVIFANINIALSQVIEVFLSSFPGHHTHFLFVATGGMFDLVGNISSCLSLWSGAVWADFNFLLNSI